MRLKSTIAALFAAVGFAGACAATALPAHTAQGKETGPQHWSFRPLKTVPLPKVRNARWVKQPVDAFILAELEKNGLAPAPEVDRRRLIRRVTFDLIGLPPAPEDVNAFVADPDPRAYEKLVVRLLASPAYGERWGRRWLDVARYADSGGMESDVDRPTAYHYRDFVIRALNQDLPFNTFVRWQIAGDEIEPDNPLAVSAVGFLAAGPHMPLNVPMEEEKVRNRWNELDDIVSTTGVAFLGMTIGCARCHDHKYDPIPTKDYYRVVAAFNSFERAELPLIPLAEAEPRLKAEREWRQKLDAAKKAKDEAAAKALETARPVPVPTVYALKDEGPKPRESFLLDRGDFNRKLEPVELGFLTTLTRGKSPADYWTAARRQGTRADTTYQRRALADWIVDTENGPGALLARVAVNRMWQGHFGEGIVRSVNDFGRRAESPTHPELLEWLANELVRGGWKLKPLHRMMVLSAAYRQDNTPNPKAAALDLENRMLWRMAPRRVESEIFRDSMMAVAGSLNTAMYGPSVRVPIPAEAMQARNVKDPYPINLKDTPETRRRTVYVFHKRVVQVPLLQAFDGPDAAASCGERNVTTVAPQALAVLNEPFVRNRAGEFARRLMKQPDTAGRVKRGYALALGRQPSNKELAASTRFIEVQKADRSARGKGTDAELLALTDFAHVLFGLNEFMYID
jgi:hypothetical protein